MYQRFLKDEEFLSFLAGCDRKMAKEAQEGNCPRCQGRLHQANYLRKPRGVSAELGSEVAVRQSFCCGSEGCRKRLTPPSLLFLGRRVYLGLAVVIAGAAGQGQTGLGVRKICELVGVSRRTLSRWRRWWQSLFVESPFWRAARGRFETPISAADLPQGLLDRFAGDACARLLALLRFLSPITTTSFPGCPAS